MVKSIKQDQDISNDKDFFFFIYEKCLKKYATPGGGLQCDPSQWR